MPVFNREFIANLFGRRRQQPPPLNLSEPNRGEPAVVTAVEPDLDDDIDESTDPAEFFPDKPSRRDYLDYKSYAETLADLIALKQTQTPLTVGVFGAWGSGKTTLLRMIETSLRQTEQNPDAQRFVFVRFDAWKYYKEDALWRAMLLRVLDALRRGPSNNLDGKLRVKIDHLEESLYRDVEWQEKGGLTIDWPKLVQAGAGGAIKLSFSFVPGLSMLVNAVQAAQEKIGEGTLADDVSAVANAFQRDVVTHHQQQLYHIEQFQREFSNLVKDHFTDRRLVIFVDDLDRCLPEKAIEVLEAIKLFLDVRGCVFILGIDQEVITRGLEAKYKDFTWSGEGQALFSTHYIEKLIQLPFHLPPIEAREVHSYLKSLNVKWPHSDCAKIFAEALSPNPRQIKRTINVFMLLWKLADKRGENLSEVVTALRLAKVVILQTAYPQVFDRLKSNSLLLKQLEIACCKDDSSAPLTDPVLAEALKQPSLKKLFRLLSDVEAASFAGLELDALTTFFSLARRAPLVTEISSKTAPPIAPAPATGGLREENLAGLREAVFGTATERPFQLRPAVRDFVGRTAELNSIKAVLRREGAIVVVTGMAGAGKTEYAFRLGEELRADYPDGQLFFDMRGTEKTPVEPTEVLSAFIRAIAGRERSVPSEPDELVAAFRSHLNQKRMLIMLDNVANAAQVTALIPPKGSALLITSRNAMVVPGMIPVNLDQLGPADAIELLRSIAPRAPEETAARICALCGYLPLAVRAAASTLAATADLDPTAYAQQLSDEQQRIKVLETEGINIQFEASFKLIYSALSSETARVFRKLATFSAPFDAEAEEIICEDPGHVNLSELVRRSLVFYDQSEKRYRVHALVRLFAQRQLEPRKSESAARRHAAYYLNVLKKANTLFKDRESSIEGLSLYDLERENIDVGFRWSAEHSNGDDDATLMCSAYARHAAQILELRRRPATRVEWFTCALSAARSSNDEGAQLAHLIDLARADVSMGESSRAISLLREALVLAKKMKLLQAEALVLSNLGVVHRDRGEIELAIKFFEPQLKIWRELDDLRGETAALVNLANACLTIDTNQAIKYYEAAREVSQRVNDLQTEGMVLGNLGRAYNKLGDTKQALALCLDQLEISRRLGDRRGEAAAHLNIGMTWQRMGDSNKARAALKTSLEIYDDLQSNNANANLARELLAKLDEGAVA